MSFAEAVALFTLQLRENPAAPCPPFDCETSEQLHDSKMLDRAFDPAQLNLGLLTPAEMQRINSAVQVDHSSAHRVIRCEQYV